MITDICREYPIEEIFAATPFADGNINDTYLIETPSERYVLQRLQKKMDCSKLQFNYELYSKACEADGILYPKWLSLRDGGFFFMDKEGQNWRMYGYLEGDVLIAPLSEEQCYACGYGLGRLHKVLSDLPDKPLAVYPHLHDIGYYYEQYLSALHDKHLCEGSRDEDIEETIRRMIRKITSESESVKSVIHGDAKISNILFQNGKVAGFLDWDTFMTGSVNEEIADCIRSCCVSDNTLDKAAFRALINGYRDAFGAGEDLADKAAVSFEKICFELALRYYTDAISAEKHFKEKYPGYRVTRAKELIKLFTHFRES
ncbi:MAG: phosphotransferase [Lachnospiraceae bacterium]|nr:phosphotransferase [Lachnospiraceae bacterium]